MERARRRVKKKTREKGLARRGTERAVLREGGGRLPYAGDLHQLLHNGKEQVWSIRENFPQSLAFRLGQGYGAKP